MKLFRFFFTFLFSGMVVLCSMGQSGGMPTRYEMKIKENPKDSIRILWIGNSFTFYNDVPKMVEKTAALNHIPISTSRILKGGEKFSGHLENPELHEMLKKGGWDYVVMQEFSSTPAYSTKYVAENIMPYAAEIDNLVKKYSPDAQTVYYMTWGHKNGNTRQTDYPLDDTYEMMQERIYTTYTDMAYENGGLLAPVGVAWREVRRNYPEIELYIEDNFHPSLAGSYLAANTLYATMAGLDFIPLEEDSLDSSTWNILIDESRKAVKGIMEDSDGGMQ